MSPLSDDQYKQVMDHLKEQNDSIKRMESAVGQVAVALTKIATLEEHKQETKKDMEELFNRMRGTEKAIAVLESTNGRTTVWLDRIIMYVVLAALAATWVLK